MAGGRFPIGSTSGTRLDVSPWLQSMGLELQRQLQNRAQDEQSRQFDESMALRQDDQQFGQQVALDEMALRERGRDDQVAAEKARLDEAGLQRKAQKEAIDAELETKKQQAEADRQHRIDLEEMQASADRDRDKFRLESELKLRADADIRQQQAEERKAQQKQADADKARQREEDFRRMQDEGIGFLNQKVSWNEDGSLSMYVPQETSPEIAAKGFTQPPIERKFNTVADAALAMRATFTKGLTGDQRLAMETAIDKWEESAGKRIADERARHKFEVDLQAKQAEIALKEAQAAKADMEAAQKGKPKEMTRVEREKSFALLTKFDKASGTYGDRTLQSYLERGQAIAKSLADPGIADVAKEGLRAEIDKLKVQRAERLAELRKKWLPELEDENEATPGE